MAASEDRDQNDLSYTFKYLMGEFFSSENVTNLFVFSYGFCRVFI